MASESIAHSGSRNNCQTLTFEGSLSISIGSTRSFTKKAKREEGDDGSSKKFQKT